MGKLRWVILVLVILAVAGFIGSRYIDLSANPKCLHDCWENGVRVR